MTRTKTSGLAVITGASAGIGATYADRLAARGHDLLLVARNQSRLEGLATILRQTHGVTVEVLQADLLAKPDLDRVAARLATDPAITLVANNAGVAVSGSLIDSDPAQLDSMIALNITAASRIAITAAKAFVALGRGTLINIASVLALAPEMFNGSYSGTKAYMLNLSQALGAEVGKHGVVVQAVLPGATRTEIWERAGIDVGAFPPTMIMEVGDMVDAALAGLDQGETVTIPSLPDIADWQEFQAARNKLGPNLSRNQAAIRYRPATARAA